MSNAADARSPRLLLVDDEPYALRALAALLSDEGFVVATADDGPSALSTIGAFAPHILVADVGLPGMTGPELVRKARELIFDMPAILLTGYPEESLAAELVELDAGYGGKPVNIGALVATIRVELARPRRP